MSVYFQFDVYFKPVYIYILMLHCNSKNNSVLLMTIVFMNL